MLKQMLKIHTEALRSLSFLTRMGWVAAVASPKGLRKLSLPAATEAEAFAAIGVGSVSMRADPAAFGSLPDEVERYLAGEDVTFSIPLDLEDEPRFFKSVWVACAKIPRGERRSYSWLAQQAGSPLAVRAAGQAMARNPAPLIIPCHRVVGSNGSLTGYGGGLAMKRRLLENETR